MATMNDHSFELSLKNIELLIRAAEVLERRDFETCDHVYASSKMMYSGSASAAGRQQRKSRSKASGAWSKSHHVGGRSLHNEMEKNRRANLRHCLERLKNAIPESRNEASKNTTLQLLKRARQCILNLEQEKDKFERMKLELLRQQNELNRMLSSDLPDADNERRRLRSTSGSSSSDVGRSSYHTDYLAYRLRSDSDSTSPSSASVSSPASASEVSDDVDIMGTGSDSDEYGQ